MSYNYKEGKKRINTILNSPNETEEKDEVPGDGAFDFGNGIIAPVAAIFVDIRDSSTYFTKQPKKQVAKMVRSYVSELVEIFRLNDNVREVGIRGDCVYAVYNAKDKDACKTIISDAADANTLINMLNALLTNKGFKTINAGIGIGYDPKEFVIKAGRKGSGINDFVWIGKAVIDASNLCSIAATGTRKSILLSEDFYNAIKDLQANDKQKYKDLFIVSWVNAQRAYNCDLVSTLFNNWVNDGMLD